ncbi:MAG: S8 family peptidase [Dactylosporangium sp.]|nr:S8 family peptidase [Dactylosporangium sp.]NNJ60715.1 S8 family peptidase [Dactylosporangium sp.]
MGGGSGSVLRLVGGGLLGAAIALAGGAAPAAAAPQEGPIRGEGEAGTIKDSYIVVLKPGVAATEGATRATKRLTSQYGGAVDEEYNDAVPGFSTKMPEQAAKRLAANASVAYVEQDRMVTLAETQTNPPSWGLDRLDQESLPLDKSYTPSTAASNVTVYMMDSGIRATHRDLIVRARSGYDFIDNHRDATDCHGHGTHVAGTIGGTTHGVAKGVSLIAVRVLNCQGSGSYSGVIKAIDWVTAQTARPAVVNMSLGGAASDAMDAAIRASTAAGITYVVSAGNAGSDACAYSPARAPETITVGATDATDTRANFSNYGACVDLFAPGVGITSTWIGSNTAVRVASGTSMASPHAAGAAALYLADNPSATPAQVRSALTSRALTGYVKNPGAGSPNRLLSVGIAAPAPAPKPKPTVTPKRCNVGSNGSNAKIPDGKRQVRSGIRIYRCAGNASRSTRIGVSIVHPRRGDLVIEIIAPDGKRTILKRYSSRDHTANIVGSYRADLSGSRRSGQWILIIKDIRRSNSGYIDSWSLTV